MLCCFLGTCVASSLQVRTISFFTSSDLWFHKPWSPCIELIIVLSSQCLPQPADSHSSPFIVVFWCLNLVHVITEFGEMKEHILCYKVCFAFSCLASTWQGYSGSCKMWLNNNISHCSAGWQNSWHSANTEKSLTPILVFWWFFLVVCNICKKGNTSD